MRVMVALRWSDMDAYGHVNNVEFLRLLEEARIRAFDQAGVGSVLRDGLLVAGQRIEYLRPLVYRTEAIPIEVWVSRIDGAGFDLGYRVLDEPEEVVCAQAQTSLVCYDLQAGRPRRLTGELREALVRVQAPPVAWRRR